MGLSELSGISYVTIAPTTRCYDNATRDRGKRSRIPRSCVDTCTSVVRAGTLTNKYLININVDWVIINFFEFRRVTTVKNIVFDGLREWRENKNNTVKTVCDDKF